MKAMQRGWVRLVVATFCWIAGGQAASAVELRTSAGDRPIVRSVAHPPRTEVMPELLGDVGGMELPSEPIESCSGRCTHGCATCCLQTYGFWFDADFLLGWRHGMRNPPLVTTSVAGTPVATAGVLNQPTTSIVYPTEPIGEEARPGGRIALGTWLDPCQCWGAEGRFFMLADRRTRFDESSNGDPIPARPFFDVVGNAPAALLVAFPGIVSPGTITIDTESDILGGDALLRRSLCRWSGGRLDLLVGYQYSRIDESLVVANRLTDIDPNNLIPDGTTLFNSDSFVTRNEYHAASLGAAAQYEQGVWRLDLMAKIGLGNMHETVTITGLSAVDNPPLGVPDLVTQNGLLAQGANLGTFTRDRFAVSPEINVRLVCHVTRCLDVSAGYTFVYWSDVAQPGLQIDPGLRAPADRFVIRDAESWIHAVTFGASCRF